MNSLDNTLATRIGQFSIKFRGLIAMVTRVSLRTNSFSDAHRHSMTQMAAEVTTANEAISYIQKLTCYYNTKSQMGVSEVCFLNSNHLCRSYQAEGSMDMYNISKKNR